MSVLGENEQLPQCLICYSDLAYPCVTPCDHNEICATCHLRLRQLHGDKKCPMCKQENQQLIVDTYDEVKLFTEYPLWGDELGSEFAYRDDVGMFFPMGYYQTEILPLFGYHCGNCDYNGITPESNMNEEADKRNPSPSHVNNKNKQNKGPTTALRALQDHLRNTHRTTLCSLCVEFKRDFVSRLPRFSPTQLKNHLSKGDGEESGFKGHPLCNFCRPTRFYDLTQLHMHLQKDHYKCHVCEKQGLPNQYFRDYAALEKHFDQQHFLCKDVQCIMARFMVFENEIDLRGHELSVHGGTSSGSTKIQLEFRVRREGYSGEGYEDQNVPSEEDFQYGVDGQAFVPEPLPQQDGPNEETSHPLHFQRTNELRAQAAQIRAAQGLESQEEAFPSLVGSNPQALRVGWASNGTMRRIAKSGPLPTTAEQFPSLPSTGRTNPNSVAAKLRSGGVSGNRQFAAMRTAAMRTATTNDANTWSNTNASSTPNPSSSPSPFITASSGGAATNRQSNLVPEQFPALGGASQTRAAYPVHTLGTANRTLSSTQPPSMSGNNFPALGAASKTRSSYPANTMATAPPPSLSSSAHFPPPPTASTKKNSVREKLLGNRAPAPINNVANFPPPSMNPSLKQGIATVNDMKGSLGPDKYKQLKNLTKEFAADSLSPHAYVDHAASLFDGGYADDDFWGFVPGLLLSCPNQSSAASAIRYMDELKATFLAKATPAPSTSWTASPALAASAPTAPRLSYTGSTAARAPPARVLSVGTATQPVSARGGPTMISTGKKQGAWGSGGSLTTVSRAKATPVSVTVAAANQAPQTGTATKFMATEKKQQNHQANTGGGGGTNKKKKKKNDELRNLAFGK